MKNEHDEVIDLNEEDIVEDSSIGIEPEDTDSEETIMPFDPKTIRISTSMLSIGQLLARIKEDAIDLTPDFQREFVWKDGAQSRLVESMLIQFPLPAFYMDATDEERWLVIDGMQRLNTVKRFVIDNRLRLRDLEYLGEKLNGKTHKELPRPLQRKIDETQVTVYKIEKGTPNEVRYNIFKRINTGGLPLSPQEIRHALHPGQANKFLAELANSEEFKRATNYSIKDRRKTDSEMVLRFLAFSITSYKEYRTNFVLFLNEHMTILNKMSKTDLENLKIRFLRAMNAAYEIFGKWSFRKMYSKTGQYSRVIKPLFEAWSVNLDKLQDRQITLLISRKEQVTDNFIKLMKERYFDYAISISTGSPQRVKTRFEYIENLIKEILEA